MAIPTASNVMDLARSHLGDEAVSGGEIFTNTILLPFVNASYRELYRTLANHQLPRIKVEAFYNLPANTSVLYPSTASIADMGEPELVEERTIGGSYAVSACSITLGVPTLTTATHPFVTGQRVVVYGLVGVAGASGMFAATCADTTHVTLNGAVATGTYTSGGTVSYSEDEFTELNWVDSIHSAENSGDDELGRVAWIGDAFRFPSCSTARQLRITYWSSAASLTSATDSIGVDDSLDYLALRTAGFAGGSRGHVGAESFNQRAVGPNLDTDGTVGGQLRQLLASAVLREQAEGGFRRPPFRRRRTALDWT